MDPSSNQGLQDAKLQTLLSTSRTPQRIPTSLSEIEEENIPSHPPPSYHMVVDPHAPLPNLGRNPYDADDEDKDFDNDELPEVTINATTQVRGHGNIISVPPMDAVRIAGLLHTMMFGPPGQQQQQQQQQPLPPSSIPLSAYASPLYSHTSSRTTSHGTTQRTRMRFPKMNITVNCGANIVGDKNVVGPGLGEVARQMQIARSQQQAAAQAAAQAQAARAQGYQAGGGIQSLPQREPMPIPAMAMPVPILTPMSRSRSDSGSERSTSSSGSVKRKREDDDVEFSPGIKRRGSDY